MILATKPIMVVIDTDNKRPIMTMGKKKGTDIAAIPNLSDTNKAPKIIHMSQNYGKIPWHPSLPGFSCYGQSLAGVVG
jgi:hypothetical protein